MGSYLRLLGSLVQNLVHRLGEDLADCAAVCNRGVVYKLRSFRRGYDDVGPGGTQNWQTEPEQLAILVETIQNKPWFCEMDRKTAQDLVHLGGSGCFLIRPSASTKSLTLTLWYHHRPYNILIRQREDGLLALGSKKDQEVTFHSVEDIVRYYEREPLILYSNGELTGKTRLKAPPPGLVRTPKNSTSVSSSSELIGGEPRCNSSLINIRRPSDKFSQTENAEEPNNSFGVHSGILSSVNIEDVSVTSKNKRLEISTINHEQLKVFVSPSVNREILSVPKLDKKNSSQIPPILFPRPSLGKLSETTQSIPHQMSDVLKLKLENKIVSEIKELPTVPLTDSCKAVSPFSLSMSNSESNSF